MADMENKFLGSDWPQEPTIRFTIDPALLERETAPDGSLEDTYVGEPLLPPESDDGPKPQGKEPAPLWVRISVLCAMGMLTLILLVSFLPRPWFGRSAQETVEKFLAALDQGDINMLCSVAQGDGVELTEQTLAPLLAVSRSDPGFTQSVRAQLERLPEMESNGRLFWLEDRSNALRSDYVVRVGTTDGVVQSNLPEAQITVGGADAVWNPELGAAVADGLLPGMYQVHGAYEAPHGGTFQAEATLYVAEPDSSCTLQFDYTTMEVYNSATKPVRIQINGNDYTVLEPQEELVVGPVSADAQITAVGPGEQHLTAKAEEGYFYVSFAMCQLEVYNDFDVPMHVALGGKWYAVIPARGKLTISDVPSGQELTAYLDERYGLEPYSYQAVYDYDYLYPSFTLGDDAYEALRLTAETYALLAYEAYNAKEEAPVQLPETALTRDLATLRQQPDAPKLTAEQIVLSEYGGLTFLPDGAYRVSATVSVLELAETVVETPVPTEHIEAPVEQEKSWTLQLEWRDGLWNVMAQPLPQEPLSEILPEETMLEP